MKPERRSLLSMLDDAVRWTGIPARVSADLSGAGAEHRARRSLRWIPLWPIAFSCTLFVLTLIWPSVLTISFGALIAAMVPIIHANGPLGRPWLEDDERESALRMQSLLFCFGLIAVLNCVGQLLLMTLSHLQSWQIARSVFVAASAFMLNLTLFGCLPTLYASWKLPRSR